MPPAVEDHTSSQPDKLDDYRWVTSAAARDWLQLAAEFQGSPVALADRLRKELSRQRTHLVLEQVEQRLRAGVKFTYADEMFFTPLTLQQATDEVIAAYKARRFPAGQPVADLCCGIGGDLLGLAARGPVVGVDLSPIALCLAEANLRVLAAHSAEPTDARLENVTVEQFDLSSFAAWHIDPDRRPHGRRTTHVELHEPGPEVIERLWRQCKQTAIKLAPAASLPPAWEDQAELEWISRGRECRQLVAWFGEFTQQPGLRRATILRDNTNEPRSIVGASAVRATVATSLGAFLYEPDPAVIAAHLVGALAAEHGLQVIEPNIAYLTGDAQIADAALACFEIEAVLPFDFRQLKKELRSRHVGRLEIKKRGLELDPAELQKKLDLRGTCAAVVIVTKVGGKAVAIIARRVTLPPPA